MPRLKALTSVTGLAAAAVGAIALAGWAADLPHLKSVFPGAVEMKANTAVGLIAAGCALLLLIAPGAPRARRCGRALAAFVGLLGVATLCEYLFGWELGIDQLLFEDKAGAFNAIRGRMSPYTTVAFASLGVALLGLRSRRYLALAYGGAGLTLFIGALSAVGYVWNATELTTDVVLPPVAVNTAIALLLLASGTLVALAQGLARESSGQRKRFAMTPIENRILVGFTAAFILLLIGGGLTYKTGVDFATSARWVAHTQQVRATLSRLHGDLSNAGWTQRNYLVTGDADQLVAYRALISKVDGQIAEIRVLMQDNPRQGASVAELQPHADAVRDFLDKGIAVYQDRGFAEAQKIVTAGAGMRAMQSAFADIDRMQAVEEQLLLRREAVATDLQRYMLASMLVTLVVAGFLFGFLFRGIRRQMRARQRADDNMVRARNAAVAARHEADLANRAKSVFLAAMSHEIRTPMNGVLGLLELLSLTPLDGDQLSTLTVATESGRSLLRIVDDILDFSKIEANRLDLSPQPGSVLELVNRICDVHSGKASSQGLLLRAQVDPAISPCLRFDPLRVEQILNNFVSNAIKFTQRGSVLLDVDLLSTDGNADRLAFTVKDTGIGVSPENLERLFQPFVQADGETTTRFGGTGLGLVICRRLAELMGGSVEMRSAVGQGTSIRFSVTFERGTAEELARKNRSTSRQRLDSVLQHRRTAIPIEQAEAEGTLVLVVDDHPTNRMVLRRQLNSLGYAAETAVDGLLAFEAWKSGRYAAIMADCNMPVMTGYELARAIRSEERKSGAKRTPIFACTANALDTEAAICIEAGMDDYLVKPIDLAQLARRLDQWLPLPPSARLFDLGQLKAISGGDPALESEMLADFRRINEQDAQMLRHAVEAMAFPEITRCAHRMVGGCAMVGARDVADACRAIEAASRSENAGGVRAALAVFEEELTRLSDQLDELVESQAR